MEKENNIKNKNLINSNRRKLLSLAGTASAGALLSPLLSKAAPSTIIEAGSNVDTASYIIFKDSGMIYAKNGTTGKIEFSGTNNDITGTTAIQNTINATSQGQTIFFKYGIYNLTSTLIVNKVINLVGEGVNWTYTLDGTVLRYSGNVLNWDQTGVNKGIHNATIRNIGFDGINNIDGNGGTASVVKLNYFHGDLYNVVIQHGDIGLDMQNSWSTNCFGVRTLRNNIGGSINTSGGSNINFFGCKFNINYNTGFVVSIGAQHGFYGCDFEYNGQYGMHLQGSGASLDGCYFEANPNYTNCINNNWTAYTAGAHIKIGDDTKWTSGVSIRNCQFSGMDTHANITDVYRIWVRHGYNQLIENCGFYQVPGSLVRTDIKNDQGSNAEILLINCTKSHDGASLVVIGTSGIKAINTNGWKTENSGSSIISDGGAIPHNLSSTPTKARLTGSVAGEIVTITSLNATNIIVAIKKPDGSSGTTQTIYWEAEV